VPRASGVTLYSRNRLKQKLGANQPALGFWLSLNSLAITEMAAGAGWDWLLLDMEHAIYDAEGVERHLLAARSGGDAEFVVRPPSHDPNLIKRLMDGGVRSFMFPFVQTVAEAEAAVASTRYPPRGIRGFSGGSRANDYGRGTESYIQDYERDICVILQVESPQAVDNIAGYATIDGVDAILIGANDLAANMDHLGDTRHPEVVAKFDEAGAAIMSAGKAAGFQFFDERMTGLLERGFTLTAVAGDMNVMLRGMQATLRGLGAKYA